LKKKGCAIGELSQTTYIPRIWPIRNAVHQTDEDGKKSVVLDVPLIKAVILYVKEARQILAGFYREEWKTIRANHRFDKAEKILEKDPEYMLWQALEDRFVNDLPASLAPVITDPFCFWVQCLYRCLEWSRDFRTEDIKEVWICRHTFVIFRTSDRAYNERHLGKRDFKCDECKQPEYVFEVR